MLKGFAHLFQSTQENIKKTRSIKTTGFIDPHQFACAENRALEICALDAVIAQHRLDFATKFNPLKGKAALHHKLLLKFKWPLREIKALPLSEILLALHDELNIKDLPGEASKALAAISNLDNLSVFTDYIDEEWNPNLAEKFLYDSVD